MRLIPKVARGMALGLAFAGCGKKVSTEWPKNVHLRDYEYLSILAGAKKDRCKDNAPVNPALQDKIAGETTLAQAIAVKILEREGRDINEKSVNNLAKAITETNKKAVLDFLTPEQKDNYEIYCKNYNLSSSTAIVGGFPHYIDFGDVAMSGGTAAAPAAADKKAEIFSVPRVLTIKSDDSTGKDLLIVAEMDIPAGKDKYTVELGERVSGTVSDISQKSKGSPIPGTNLTLQNDGYFITVRVTSAGAAAGPRGLKLDHLEGGQTKEILTLPRAIYILASEPKREEPPKKVDEPPKKVDEPPKKVDEPPKKVDEPPKKVDEPPKKVDEPPKKSIVPM